MKNIVDLQNIDITNITREVREKFPNMSDDEIVKYIEQILSEKEIKDIIVSLIYYRKGRETED